MSELSNVWKVRCGGSTRWCYKYNITVSGCTHHIDCKDCEYAKKELKDAPKEPNKRQRKLPTSNIGDIPNVKKRGRKRRDGDVSGSICNEKPIKVSKTRDNSKVRRRPRSTHQEKLIT